MSSGKYDFGAVEAKWQKYWLDNKTFATPDKSAKPKYYILDMFPYPSGAGLHVGHPEGYTATDIVARYKRMRGFNVLHPMGWDAFGLPAEQYAIESGTHPRETTGKNIDVFRRQVQSLGFSYDWDRELDTTDPGYYRWTQWIFLQMFKKGLAYEAKVAVNWCPALGTVLANEEVTAEGLSDRGNHPVERRGMKQWMLKITDYAERLLNDLDKLDWPEPIKIMQRNWIGRSEGAEVDFALSEAAGEAACSVGEPKKLRVFTTRPDTLFGATYMVLAPEHPLAEVICRAERQEAVKKYCDQAKQKAELARTDLAKEKTGIFTGAYAVNPVNGEEIPIWVADYVLISYGSGAIMAVPGHDGRDFEFAKQFDLPIRAVVMPPSSWLHGQIARGLLDQEYAKKQGQGDLMEELMRSAGLAAGTAGGLLGGMTAQDPLAALDGDVSWFKQVAEPLYKNDPGVFADAYAEDGEAINSGRFDGQSTEEFKKNITAWLSEKDLGKAAVNYKLRDWLFSRQRYWGEPFPVLHGPDGEIVAVDENDLPVTLPEMDNFRPDTTGTDEIATPLSRAKEWGQVEIGGKTYRRDLHTMPQWAGSCWYYLRFIDPHNELAGWDRHKERYWMPVDLYVGGAEHAVLHLLYSRFWHKVLYDLGLVSTDEPFAKLFNQGMIRSFSYRDSRGTYIPYELVEYDEGKAYHKETKEELSEGIEKMSKSLKNVINPDDVVGEYGADTLRLYEMAMGPLDASKPWNTRDVPGVHRFLHRAWRLVVDPETAELAGAVQDVKPKEKLNRLRHKTIKKVGEDIEEMAFNTAISTLIVLVNELTPMKVRPREVVEDLVLLLSPLAPHIAEELWERLGHDESLAYEGWPRYDEALTREKQMELAVQVNGKLVERLAIEADADDEAISEAAKALEKVARQIEGKEIGKLIIARPRVVNIVVTR